MSQHDPVMLYHPQDLQLPASADRACTTLLQLTALGGIVGASAAAGANIRWVQRDEISAGQALTDTGRAVLAAATATAVAGAAATAISNEGLTRLGVLFLAGTAVMYGLQRWREAA